MERMSVSMAKKWLNEIQIIEAKGHEEIGNLIKKKNVSEEYKDGALDVGTACIQNICTPLLERLKECWRVLRFIETQED